MSACPETTATKKTCGRDATTRGRDGVLRCMQHAQKVEDDTRDFVVLDRYVEEMRAEKARAAA